MGVDFLPVTPWSCRETEKPADKGGSGLQTQVSGALDLPPLLNSRAARHVVSAAGAGQAQEGARRLVLHM